MISADIAVLTEKQHDLWGCIIAARRKAPLATSEYRMLCDAEKEAFAALKSLRSALLYARVTECTHSFDVYGCCVHCGVIHPQHSPASAGIAGAFSKP